MRLHGVFVSRKRPVKKTRFFDRPLVMRAIGVIGGITLTVGALAALRRGEPDYYNYFRQRPSAHIVLVLGVIATVASLVPERLLRSLFARSRTGRSLRTSKRPTFRARRIIARNQPCPCGSGRKYKHCCLEADAGRSMKAKALLFPLLAVLSMACVGACSSAPEDGNQAPSSALESLESGGDDHEVIAGTRVSRYPDFVPQAWFPLEEGARYTFKGTFKDETYLETLNVVRHETPFGHLYFFAEDENIEDPSPLLSANMFGLAGYLTTATEMLTVQASYIEGFQAEPSAYIQTLLRFPPKAGDSLEFEETGLAYRLEVSGREDVIVPAGRFEDCLKLKIDHLDEGSSIESFVWLAENVGMVRWKRNTGRVDELVRYEVPPRTESSSSVGVATR